MGKWVGMDVVRVPAWAKLPWLLHGFSTRAGGVSEAYGTASLNLGWTKEDSVEAVGENRRRLMLAVGGTEVMRLVTLRQVHSDAIHVVREEDSLWREDDGRSLLTGDGLMTDRTGVLLGVQTADCVPILLVDPRKRAVAVLHAGWRGAAAGLLELGVERMRREYGSEPGEMLAAVGPSIGPCCYPVGEEVRAAFATRYTYADALFEEDRIDLREANRRQLLTSGLAAEHISIIAECTGCLRTAIGERKYFSHRTEGGRTGRMMSVVGLPATWPEDVVDQSAVSLPVSSSLRAWPCHRRSG